LNSARGSTAPPHLPRFNALVLDLDASIGQVAGIHGKPHGSARPKHLPRRHSTATCSSSNVGTSINDCLSLNRNPVCMPRFGQTTESCNDGQAENTDLTRGSAAHRGASNGVHTRRGRLVARRRGAKHLARPSHNPQTTTASQTPLRNHQHKQGEQAQAASTSTWHEARTHKAAVSLTTARQKNGGAKLVHCSAKPAPPVHRTL
jgi:hypothetical protein